MRKKFQIKVNNNNCKIIVEFGILKKYLNSLNKSKFKNFIIVDSKISKNLKKIIKPNQNMNIIEINANEKIKSFDSYSKLTSLLLKKKIDRSSNLIAIGGGTIGDLCGFIASTILRGVKYISIPSTLLSQVDSSIGGKNGINTKYGKNLIGTFYHPDTVLIDPYILKTLSTKQIKSGYAEIIKYALINDKKFFLWLDKHNKKIINLNKSALFYAISKSINTKLKYVLKDEKEKLINNSSRAMLNFGHTFGHALESINNYKTNLTHGEAISIGMIIASKISYKLNKISKNDLEKIIQHFKIIGLPYTINKLNERVYKIMLRDKKNSKGKINLILLNKIGKSCFERGLEINNIKNLIN